MALHQELMPSTTSKRVPSSALRCNLTPDAPVTSYGAGPSSAAYGCQTKPRSRSTRDRTGATVSGIGRKLRAGSPLAKTHTGVLVRARFGTQHPEASVGDHLKICLGLLALAGQVVTEEEGVGDLQCKRLERTQVHLATGGHAQLGVGAGEADQRENAKAGAGGEQP